MHLLFSIFNPAVIYHTLNDLPDSFFLVSFIFNYIYKVSSCTFIYFPERIYEGKGKLLFTYIVARRFANFLVSIIKKVIFYLERNSHFLTKVMHFFGNVPIFTRRISSCCTGGSQQGGSFTPYNIEIYIFLNI